MDGEFNWSEGLYKCNVRMAIIPTIWGDRVTLRIHYKESHRQICTLSKLKLQSKILEELNNYTQKKPGLAIFAGPTGSGKTTLLYALLLELKAKGKEILTIEDPVELTLPGISQCSIRPESGLTFASALKSILRHCPDVIMIGEVRDAESANAMIQAALTGHYVLTTTHATDVSGVITRLVEFGIKESMIKEATRLIVVQNLMPTLCRVCRKKESDSCYWYSSGCESCLWRGFKGRVPVNEFLSGDIRLLNLGSNYFNDMCPGLRYSSMQQSIDQAKRNGLISTSCQ
jgi:general secretion pathway protein E